MAWVCGPCVVGIRADLKKAGSKTESLEYTHNSEYTDVVP